MRLEKRNGKAYLYDLSTDYLEPRIIASYWLIDIDPDLLPDDAIIERFLSGYICNTGWKLLPLNIPEYPAFTEFYPIKPPRKTGYIWRDGEWVKK